MSDKDERDEARKAIREQMASERAAEVKQGLEDKALMREVLLLQRDGLTTGRELLDRALAYLAAEDGIRAADRAREAKEHRERKAADEARVAADGPHPSWRDRMVLSAAASYLSHGGGMATVPHALDVGEKLMAEFDRRHALDNVTVVVTSTEEAG